MSASITDVARRAGVSVATVSRALRGLPNVAPGTRERVLAAAGELEYVADRSASRLATGRIGSVAVVVDRLSRWFTAEVVAGVEPVVAAAGYDLLLVQASACGGVGAGSGWSPVGWRKRAEGLLAVALPCDCAAVEAIGGEDVPTVVVGGRVDGLSWVGVDDRAAAATATRHLVNLGHERIGLIAGPVSGAGGQSGARRAGYRDALESAGLALDEGLEVVGGFTVDGGAEAMAHLLAGPALPSAVFAMSDEMALGAVRTLQAAGLRVPEDVSVVGFDDHELAACTGLTTIHQPAARIGESAAALLLERVEAVAGGEASVSPLRVTVPTKLQVRTTTAPNRRAAAAAAASG